VLCGDYNIAHEPIDLAHPKANEGNPGYLPEERAWMGKFLGAGYADSFRRLHPGEAGQYSWWSYRMRAREKNVGWRIDYCCVNEAFWPAVRAASIQNSVLGSDHCPVGIELAL
jgi:exodeoxyribonuclease-3